MSDELSGDRQPAPMMSTGVPSTLANWLAMCVAIFGPESKATKFIEDKLTEQGPDMAVLSDEGQLVQALIYMHLNSTPPTEGEPS